MEGIVLRMVLSLSAVLALMVGLLFLVKRFVLPGTGPVRMPVQIEVLGKRSLQPKKSIVVVGVAGKVLVLGLSEQGMHTLTELTQEEVQAVSPAQTPGTSLSGLPFSAHLQETLRTIRRRQKTEVVS
jgi:flagellar biosynthetic protein FliO